MKNVMMIVCVSLAGCVVPTTNRQANGNCRPDGAGNCICTGSPILLDLEGDGIRLTSPENGAQFSLSPGQRRLWSWTAAGTDDAWLVLDRDGNGLIDDGTEMFGDYTAQPLSKSPNGFAALAVFDVNHDGRVDASDPVWSSLRLWNDHNADGVSQTDELSRLDASGIRSISVEYVRPDALDVYGNEFRFAAPVVASSPVGHLAYDVWLRSKAIPKAPQFTTTVKCVAWGYYRNYNGTDVCSTPYVQADPIATNGQGSLSRLVARSATRVSADSAAEAAIGVVANAALLSGVPSPEECYGMPIFPVPDLYRAPPYYFIFETWARVKCEDPVTTGGGGGDTGSCD